MAPGAVEHLFHAGGKGLPGSFVDDAQQDRSIRSIKSHGTYRSTYTASQGTPRTPGSVICSQENIPELNPAAQAQQRDQPVRRGAAVSMSMQSQQGSCTSQSLVPSSLLFSYPLASSPPLARWAHAAVALRGGAGGMLVHGGIGNSMMDDVAVLDGDSFAWRQIHTAGASKDRPEKCMGHSAVFLNDLVWIFGGQQGRKLLAKLYSLDINTWTWRRHNPSTMPAPRAGHAMVTIERGPSSLAVAYMFGGQGKKLMNDLYTFVPDDHGQPVFKELTSTGRLPSPRRGHSLVWDGYDTLVVFGGTHTYGIDNSLHAYSISRNEWFVPATTGSAPSPRTQHTAAMLGSHAMLVFGGCNAQGTFFSDCYLLDTSTWTWSRPTLLNAAPAPRYHHSCVVINGRAIIYGGINSKQTFEGIVVVDSKFDNDICHIAEELTAMASGSLFTPLHTGLATNSVRSTETGTAQTPGAQLMRSSHMPEALTPMAASSTPLASSFTAAAGGSSVSMVPTTGTSGMMLDLMKAQLTDLLVKRNMEEVQQQTQRRAEAAEATIVTERQRCESLSKEVVALKLLVSEAEAARDSWEQRYQDAQAKAARDATQLAEAQADAAGLRTQLVDVRRELSSALALQQGLLKELSVLSSRHTRLQEQYESLRRSMRGNNGSSGSTSTPHSQGRAGSSRSPVASTSLRQAEATHQQPQRDAVPQLVEQAAVSAPLDRSQGSTDQPVLQTEQAAATSAAPAAISSTGGALVDSVIASTAGLNLHQDNMQPARGRSVLPVFGGYLIPPQQAPAGPSQGSGSTSDMSALDASTFSPQHSPQDHARSILQAHEQATATAHLNRMGSSVGGGRNSGELPSVELAGALLQGLQQHGLCMSAPIVVGHHSTGHSSTGAEHSSTAVDPPSLGLLGAGIVAAGGVPASPATSTQNVRQGTSEEACMQLLRLLSASEQARASASEQASQLRSDLDTLQQALRATQENAAEARAAADRYAATPAALTGTSLTDLRSLELELEGVCRRVREEVVRRAMEQATRKPSAEACCGICMEWPRAVVFSCGHQACDRCSDKVKDTCPFCRASISAKIRLFDA